MKRSLIRFAFLVALLSPSFCLVAQPIIQWDRSFGGNLEDELVTAFETSDGGYIMGGYSRSKAGGVKSEASSYFGNSWILKINSSGAKERDKTFTQSNELFSIIAVGEAGYLVGTRFGTTIRLIRIKNDGTKIWEKDLNAGDLGWVTPEDMTRTNDGGYLIAATASATAGNDKSETTKGGSDYWIIKIDSNGKVLWEKTIGGSSFDIVSSVKEAPDGSCIIAGSSVSESSGDKSENSFEEGYDYWLIKLDANGKILWEKTIGGNGHDSCESVFPTTDGGYIIGGYSDSPLSGDKTQPSVDSDYWIIKITANGDVQWDRSLSGTPHSDNYYNFQRLSSIIQSPDGGYIAVGTSNLNSGHDKSEDSKGDFDIWIVRLAADGKKLWDKTIGGEGSDAAASVSQTRDGGHVIGGWSFSFATGDKTQTNMGENDYWLVKLNPESSLPVTLMTFNARREGRAALLTWQTTLETRSDRFEVGHSLDGITWNILDKVTAKGESSDLQTYQYVHASPVVGVNLYRLKMIDLDCSFAYSKIESLQLDSNFAYSIFPNPATEILTIESSDWRNVKAVQLLNSRFGEIYHSGFTPLKNIDVKKLASGLYYVKIFKQNGTSVIQKVIIAR